MERTRVALGSTLVGFALLTLGFVVTPGLVSKTAVACSSYEPATFRGFAGASLVWYDGCNDWFVSVPALLGVASLAVSACLGVTAVAPRVREAVASGR
jgi:hypothetical protein